MRSPGLLSLIMLCTPPLVLAQDVTPLVLEGDVITGVGTVTSVDQIAINGVGDWLVGADTDNPDTDIDGVVIRNGTVFLQEGQDLTFPPSSTIGGFDSLWLNAAGDGAFHLDLDGTSGYGDDAGIFWNTSLILQEGAYSTAPQFSPSTPYIYFSNLYLNSADQILISATVNDPNLSESSNKALVLLDTDGLGYLTAEAVISKQGDLGGSGSWPVDHPGTRAQEFSFNDTGQVLYTVYLDTGTDVVVAIYLDSTLLAEELAPSPIPGRSWDLLTNPELGMNNYGEYVFSGRLDGDSSTNWVIIKNGDKLVQEGETLPGMGGYSISNFGSGPIEIADNGDVLWYADWNDPDTSVDSGFFVNDRLIVQEGVTQVGGVPIDTIRGTDSDYHFSPSGQFVIFKGILDDGTEGVFTLDLGVGTPFCFGDDSGTLCPCGNTGGPGAGCASSTGFGATLFGRGTASVSADALVFSAMNSVPGQPGLFFQGNDAINGGLGILFGDGLRCAGGGVRRLGVSFANAMGIAKSTFSVATMGAVSAGDTRRYQWWYRDPAGSPCNSEFNLSNGIEFTWTP